MTNEIPTQSVEDFSTFLKTSVQMNNRYLRQVLPSTEYNPTDLEKAMHFSVFAGGKRFRPTLVYATVQAFGMGYESAHSCAAALELIHTYSLVHDDLPAMDNDDLRRGQPTCHIAFDEASAILAGDALQSLAFEVLANDERCVPDPAQRLELIKVLTHACGTHGMAGGQALDLVCENKAVTLKTLKLIHQLKTGRLIEAAVDMGAIIAGASPMERKTLKHYAEHLGLAFQIYDDILDVIGDQSLLGKPVGSDEAQQKSTYPSLVGLEQAQTLARQAADQCHKTLDELNRPTHTLRQLAELVIERSS